MNAQPTSSELADITGIDEAAVRSAPVVHAAYVYEAPVRAWHWINALAIVVLGITGYFIGQPLWSLPGEASKRISTRRFSGSPSSGRPSTRVNRARPVLPGNRSLLCDVRTPAWRNAAKPISQRPPGPMTRPSARLLPMPLLAPVTSAYAIKTF